MKFLGYTILLQLFAAPVFAQNPAWAKHMGGTSSAGSYCMKTDANGNVYTAGIFYGTVDFDPGTGVYDLTSFDDGDIFICKLTAGGNFAWAKQFSGIRYQLALDLAVDAAGNVYTTGQFENTTDFDPGPATYNLVCGGFEDVFVSKLDNNGNFVWAKALGGPDWEIGTSISVDNNGNVYTMGQFAGITDFNPSAANSNLITTGLNDIFICKLDASGNFQWAKKVGGLYHDEAFDMVQDAAGNIFFTGSFDVSADFDPGAGSLVLNSKGESDIFVCKLDPSGNLSWAKAMGGSKSDKANALALDKSGNVFISGIFIGQADFDPGAGELLMTPTFASSPIGSSDIFITKLNTSGNLLWARQMGGIISVANTNRTYGIETDQAGNIYATGNFYLVPDFDPGAGRYHFSAFGVADVFLLKLDAAGNFGYATQVGGAELDHVTAMDIDNSGNILVSGWFSGTADFDPCAGTSLMTTTGVADIFVVKYSDPNLIPSLNPGMTLTPSSATICSGQPVTFTANASNAGTNPYYLWKLNNAYLGTNTANPIYTNSAITAQDLVSCEVVNANNSCSATMLVASDSVRVAVITPSLSITSSADSICPGEAVTFKAFPLNAGLTPKYQWKINGTEVGNTDHTFNSAGLKSGDMVTCEMNASAVCPGATHVLSNTKRVIIKDRPQIVFDPKEAAIMMGDSVQLTAMINGAYRSFSWFPLTGLTAANTLRPVAKPVAPITYKLSVVASNNCHSEASLSIKVFNGIYIPGSFTPNDDKLNDEFRVPAGMSFKLKSFVIYNRFGTKVFTTTDIRKGWDGMFNGSRCPQGVYAYIIDGENTKGKINIRSTVTLLR